MGGVFRNQEDKMVTLDLKIFDEIRCTLVDAQQLLEALQQLIGPSEETAPLLRVAYVISDKLEVVEKILDSAPRATQDTVLA
jgi:hypothetical protein